MQKIFFWVTLVILNISSVTKATSYIDDGAFHVISDSTYSGDTLYLDYYTANDPGTHIEILEGGVTFRIYPFNNSKITVSGGTVAGNNVAIDTQGDNQVLITGGTVTGDIASNNNSNITVTGGIIHDDLYAYDDGIVNVKGSQIGGILGVFNSGRIYLYGSDFQLGGVDLNFGDSLKDYPQLLTSYSGFYRGVITGTLSDGSALNSDFWIVQESDADIIVIPEPTTLLLSIDIKPASCPNPLNVNSKGVLSVAILGTEVFDVNEIDVSLLEILGVRPIRSGVEDVATPLAEESLPEDCLCTIDGPDGYLDLTLKFDTQDIVEAIGEVEDGDYVVLTLTGLLTDGTLIEGTDCVIIHKKEKQ